MVKITIFICGVIIGSVLSGFLCLIFLQSLLPLAGTLKWMQDEDGMYPYIEGSVPFEEITKKHYILLEVDKS